MQTNKEKTHCYSSRTTWNKHLCQLQNQCLGLVDEAKWENQIPMAKCHHKRSRYSMIKSIVESIINPFTVILLVIALVSLHHQCLAKKPGEQDPTTSIIIVTLVLISGGIRFIQEIASDKRLATFTYDCQYSDRSVMDRNKRFPLMNRRGDDQIKCRRYDSSRCGLDWFPDFFVQQSGLTGESDAVESLSQKKPLVKI